jgi:outer membrane protein OmpA-like peptidoglycan-associated protein
MTLRRLVVFFGFAAALAIGAPHGALAKDADYERLVESYNRLAADPKLGNLAPVQMDRARAALQVLKDSSRSDRPHLVYITERRIAIARTTAQAALMEAERNTLQRDNDRLQLAAARRDAEQAHRELEQQRLQAQIRAEETERLAREAEAAREEGAQAAQAAEAARAEAAQSKRMADAQAKAAALAKREAELSGSVGAAPAAAAAPKRRMTLSDSSFVAGQAALAPAGSSRIAGVVDFINAAPGARVHVQASAAGNAALAKERAESIRDALVAAGVAASRIDASGSGGKSRQVEITLDGAE